MPLFVFSLQATRQTQHGVIPGHGASWVSTKFLGDAVQHATKLCEEKLPASQGWRDHSAAVTELPVDEKLALFKTLLDDPDIREELRKIKPVATT